MNTPDQDVVVRALEDARRILSEYNGWIDDSDLGAVVDHARPLQHPTIDQPQ